MVVKRGDVQVHEADLTGLASGMPMPDDRYECMSTAMHSRELMDGTWTVTAEVDYQEYVLDPSPPHWETGTATYGPTVIEVENLWVRGIEVGRPGVYQHGPIVIAEDAPNRDANGRAAMREDYVFHYAGHSFAARVVDASGQLVGAQVGIEFEVEDGTSPGHGMLIPADVESWGPCSPPARLVYLASCSFLSPEHTFDRGTPSEVTVPVLGTTMGEACLTIADVVIAWETPVHYAGYSALDEYLWAELTKSGKSIGQCLTDALNATKSQHGEDFMLAKGLLRRNANGELVSCVQAIGASSLPLGPTFSL
ncbi:MAG: hypothetical protein GF320_07275 [Armatimonadia bacterium]|nr:hypothetical protein [Armatimonadia bacterium]